MGVCLWKTSLFLWIIVQSYCWSNDYISRNYCAPIDRSVAATSRKESLVFMTKRHDEGCLNANGDFYTSSNSFLSNEKIQNHAPFFCPCSVKKSQSVTSTGYELHTASSCLWSFFHLFIYFRTMRRGLPSTPLPTWVTPRSSSFSFCQV